MKNTILKAFRHINGLTQIDVAERLGISQPTYSRIEAGTREPSAAERARLESLFPAAFVGKKETDNHECR